MTANHSIRLLKRIDAACDRFEDEWRAGRRPRLEDFVAQAAVEDRAALLHALSQLQQELVLKQFESSTPEIVFAEASAEAVDEPLIGAGVTSADERPDVASDMARVVLTVTEGPHAGQRFDIDRHETLLAGRSTKAQLRLKLDPHFSRHHFRLEVAPPVVHLIDLDSRNGTFVNGERVRERTLTHGDVISGGDTTLVVALDDCVRTLDVSLVPSSPPPAVVPIPEWSPPTMPLVRPVSSNDARIALADGSRSESIPGYEVLASLGRGPLGTVYRARRLATQEDCVVKVLEPATQVGERNIQSFLREARVLSQLQHRHLVRLLDMGAVGGRMFLATEYVGALPWDEVLAEISVGSRIRLACGVACQILDGLQYAHSRSLVHRDIKPSNIFVVRDGRKRIAKLSDFGVAKYYTDAGFSQITRDGDVIGSLPYMSPEQFIDSRHARPTCDIYSLGATLYRLLCGRDPIELDSSRCKFLAILEDDPTPIGAHLPTVPPGLAALVHRALAKDPLARFASAAEMRHALLSFARRK